MAKQLDIEDVLRRAIQKEVEASLLYTDLSMRMSDKAAKDAFQELASQEQRHQHLLEQYLRGELKEGAISSRQSVDYKIAEHLEQPEMSSEMKLKDVFLLAANREKASHELYMGLAQIHPVGDVRRLFEELASQELKHKQTVEFLYTEVAFPQTDGG